MNTFLDFEQPIAELEGKVEELRHLSRGDEINIVDEVGKLQEKAQKLLAQTYEKLTPWQKVKVARHPGRPHCNDYVFGLIEDFTPLAGDRNYGEDKAIMGGLGRFRGQACVVIGQEKGANTDERVAHNFGMARPEGYRKAARLMALADRFTLPIITFVDTPGAYPGVGAEERGQAEAIASCINKSLNIKVPIISTVIGEGGSGGAIAIATGDRVMMLEHSIYSVISPEGCASILWRSAEASESAAEALRLTAQDLKLHGLIDKVIKEPLGGAHRNKEDTINSVGNAIEGVLQELMILDGGSLRAKRREKFLKLGQEGLA
ncbi:MAG: acetyl-CoA carboxylase carboxyl transferase subunit alpha [Rhodospirillaceae bacterium]|nr:acetyl-CoA carboxylase carboxyl transferase subunit alpha [Rhodospirillaceae bacterium]|tara:strand:+ start:69 stop:1025 length:957 start_codon:yes stop_codon:yes gene_type:complete